MLDNIFYIPPNTVGIGWKLKWKLKHIICLFFGHKIRATTFEEQKRGDKDVICNRCYQIWENDELFEKGDRVRLTKKDIGKFKVA
ncbi:hypothetical protein LCGC14_0885420 [marine sediment metagenome]|uniref:Uncharacterized protein n=1 Tax=marine sediment metagenome TaxID=412755 RepID=A0A0F9PLD7_9ZZZZ